MNKTKIAVFLIIAFVWSWGSWFVGLHHLKAGISELTISKFLVVFFLGVYGPSVSAIFTTLFFDGPKGLLELLKKLFILNVPVFSYVYVVVLPIVFVLIGIGLYAWFVGDIGQFDKMAYLGVPIVIWSGLYAGPLGEELGWRGFLLPELQREFSNFVSAIIIGIVWFAWHIPLFWAPFGTLVSGSPITVLPVIIYFVILLCLSIIITWLVVRSKGSVFIAILFHLSINAGLALLFYPTLAPHFKEVHLLSVVGMAPFAAILVVFRRLNTDEAK